MGHGLVMMPESDKIDSSIRMNERGNEMVRQISNVVAFLIMLAVNFLANALPIAGRGTGEISDMFPVLFTPAGYAFGIWGVIYLGLGTFVIYQALPSQRENPRLRKVGYWFAANALLNALWIFLWHNLLITLSMAVMLGLLVTLVVIDRGLETGRNPRVSSAEKWFARLPFSIYFGWISVATIANASIMLYNLGWRGEPLDEPTWAALVIAIAAAIGVVMIFKRREAAFPLVLVWAFVGIFVNQTVRLVEIVALSAAILVALTLAGDRIRRRGMEET
jgi:translocator protein